VQLRVSLGAAHGRDLALGPRRMTKLIPYLSTALALASLAGCKKNATSCESLYEHTLALAPPDLKPMLEQGKADGLTTCEQMPEEARKCLADAETFEAMRACKPPRKHGGGDEPGKHAAAADVPAAAGKPVETAPAPAAPAAPAAQTAEQLADHYKADKSLKGTHATVSGLYLTTTKDKSHRPTGISLKTSKDAMQILECDAGADLAAFAASEHDLAQWTPITVEGDVTEKNWAVALNNCSIHKS
jgi:hypothetical protein